MNEQQGFPLGGALVAVVNMRHRTQERWQGSLRLRAGVAFDRVLLCATGGLAFNNRRYTFGTVAAPSVFAHTASTWGWTLGAGLEYAINNNWSARGEYRYSQYPGKTTAFPAIVDRVGKYATHTFRIGLSYSFRPRAEPVVAKY